MEEIAIHVDGATGSETASGVAAVARTAGGHFRGWLSRRLPAMTNNEAEYHGALLGLELARALAARRVRILSDSEVVVFQMQGRSRVNSRRLRRLHRQTCVAVRDFESVAFQHVPRGQNRLADALAGEALTGRTVQLDGYQPPEASFWGRLLAWGNRE